MGPLFFLIVLFPYLTDQQLIVNHARIYFATTISVVTYINTWLPAKCTWTYREAILEKMNEECGLAMMIMGGLLSMLMVGPLYTAAVILGLAVDLVFLLFHILLSTPSLIMSIFSLMGKGVVWIYNMGLLMAVASTVLFAVIAYILAMIAMILALVLFFGPDPNTWKSSLTAFEQSSKL